MCYLKNFKRISNIPTPKDYIIDQTEGYSSDESNFLQSKEKQFFAKYQNVQAVKEQKSDEMLSNLMNMLNSNTALLNKLEMKINTTHDSLTFLQNQFSQAEHSSESCIPQETLYEESQQISKKEEHLSTEPLTIKLFGNKCYKYKLEIDETEFPSIIYKERNIAFGVKLVTTDGTVVRNSNMIHLCLGVSDVNGQWIAETRNGENFMKGKTETELYHGESNYSKIYPRDVSRSYEGGKINFVVYPKPSMLHYAGNNSSLESRVNVEEIEPLVIKDLTIRAKKKD